jgi:molecular chaperone Hsp33
MNDDIKKQWRERDRVVKAITRDGMFRGAVVHNTQTVRTAQHRHHLEPLRSLMLARALTGVTLLASFLKGEERVVVQLEGDGAISSVYAEALQVGEVRGFARLNKHPQSEGALGKGLLKIQRVLYGNYEPVTGIVELRRGDVQSDLGYYLTQSEQIPSAFIMDVEFDDDDTIIHSVGLLIQAMPGAKPEEIFKVYDTLDYLDRLSTFIKNGFSPEEVLKQVLPEEAETIATSPVDFFCRCSREKFKNMLLTLDYNEISEMQQANQRELICQYCNAAYQLSDDDFAELKEQLLARRN